MGERRSVSPEAEREIYQRHFSAIQEVVVSHDVDARVVGGTAVNALLDRSLVPRRDSGEVRDIDYLILNRFQDELGSLSEDVLSLRGGLSDPELFPSVSLNGLVRLNPKRRRVLPRLYSRFTRTEAGSLAFVYNDVTMPVSEELFQVHELAVAGGVIRTVSPETLLHLYLIRGGSVKPKDKEKLERLAAYIASNPTPGSNDVSYEQFHNFAGAMRIQHPLLTGAFRLVEQAEARFPLHRLVPGASRVLQ